MKIVVLDGHTLARDDVSWAELKRFGEVIVWPRSDASEILARAYGADILLTNKTPVTAAVMEKHPTLKYISVLATGYNVVDTVAARHCGIPVSNVPAYGTRTVAQHVLALMLELANHVGEHACSVREGEWAKSPDWTYWKSPLIELDGLTLGILGFGRIGQRVAELGHALGMKIIYSARASDRAVLFPAQRVSQEELFSRSDFLSLHCGLTDETLELVNRQLLERMKPSAFLINTARGQLIRESDLADALQTGTLAGAALDVLSSEPPAPDNPLLRAPNCVITPHIAWGSLAARRRILATTIENVKSFIAGAPINVVNS